MYRHNAADELSVPPPPPPRIRPALIAVFSVAVHAAVFGAAFAARAPTLQGPKTATVQVLTGQVDPWTGDFRANGLRMARVRN